MPLVCRVQQTLANKENVCLLFFLKGCVLIVSGGLIESSADPGAGWER